MEFPLTSRRGLRHVSGMTTWPLFRALSLGTSLAFLGSVDSGAADWPHWRGPSRDGLSTESGWSVAWPKDGPRKLWEARVGTGFSSVSVSGGRAYTIGNSNDKDTVYCFDANTGAELWKQSYDEPLDSHFYEGGASSTPTVAGDAVYVLSRKGRIARYESASGKIVWEKNIARETGAAVPEWGFAGSPLVEGASLLFNVGSFGTAVDAATGKLLWTTGKEASGYATPVPYTAGGTRAVLCFAAKALVAVSVKDGKELWRFPWVTSYDVNAADPIIAGDRVFLSSGYGRGAALLRVEGHQVTKLWENKHLRNQFNSSVLIGGHLYGLDDNHGDKSSNLRCVELETGVVKWKEPSVRPGGLIAADGKLIAVSDKGELVICAAAPDAFQPLARAQVLGGKCWTTPTLAHGRIYLRNSKGTVVCLDVKNAPTAAQ